MRPTKIHNSWLAAMLLAVSIAAFADPPASSGSTTASPDAGNSNRQWTTADKNGDGLLSREELLPFPAFSEDFVTMDSNGDGQISRGEYASWRDSHKEE